MFCYILFSLTASRWLCHICWVWSLLGLLKEAFDRRNIPTTNQDRGKESLKPNVYNLSSLFRAQTFQVPFATREYIQNNRQKRLLLHSKAGTYLTDPVGKLLPGTQVTCTSWPRGSSHGRSVYLQFWLCFFVQATISLLHSGSRYQGRFFLRTKREKGAVREAISRVIKELIRRRDVWNTGEARDKDAGMSLFVLGPILTTDNTPALQIFAK